MKGTTGPCDATTTSSSQTEAGSTTVGHSSSHTEAGSTTVGHSSSQTEAGSTTVDHAGSTVPSITTPERPNNAEIITESSQTTTQTTQLKSTTVVSSNSEKSKRLRTPTSNLNLCTCRIEEKLKFPI